MKKVVIIGGGFGGLSVIAEISKYTKRGVFDVTLIDKNNFSLFTPMLPEVVSGNVSADNIVFPLRDICVKHNITFVRENVERVDVQNNQVICSGLTLKYDYLVVAAGSTTNFRGNTSAISSCTEYKSINDAINLKYAIIELLEMAVDAGSTIRRSLLSFSIIGGGITGVELACEIIDFIKSKVKKEYCCIDESEYSVTIFEYDKTILPAIDSSQAAKAQKYIEGKGIKVINRAMVQQIKNFTINYKQDDVEKSHQSNIIIWTAGVQGQDFLKTISPNLSKDNRIFVDTTLQPLTCERSNIFVIGDSCAYKFRGGILPPVAPLAMQQASIVVDNIFRKEHRKGLREFKYIHFGYLVSLGKNNSVVNLFGFKFRGRSAYFLWKFVYIYKIGMIKKQMGVFFDWVMSTLFGNEASLIISVENCPGKVLKNINGRTYRFHQETCKKCNICAADSTKKQSNV